MIIEWGIAKLDSVLQQVGIRRGLLITSSRWAEFELEGGKTFRDVRPHTPVETVQAAILEAERCDGLVALGGGSAIDTAKAVSGHTGLPVVSIPTTYSGAEWTSAYGMRDEVAGVKVGGSGARVEGIVYDVNLTLELPRAETGGTALNALAHCAEALYVAERNERSDRDAVAGAKLIGDALPAVLEDGHDVEARLRLLKGARYGGAALAGAGLGLAHAMAQALGGRYGLPHGALNALCLPPALRFNQPLVGVEIECFGDALGGNAIVRVEELARLAGFERLRDLGVPEEGLPDVAAIAASRAGTRQNPRVATTEDITELLRSIW